MSGVAGKIGPHPGPGSVIGPVRIFIGSTANGGDLTELDEDIYLIRVNAYRQLINMAHTAKDIYDDGDEYLWLSKQEDALRKACHDAELHGELKHYNNHGIHVDGNTIDRLYKLLKHHEPERERSRSLELILKNAKS